MKCLVINLDRSPDRWAHIRTTFERLNLSFTRVAAVDGAQLTQSAVEEFNAINHWVRPLVNAEIGCFMSHRACWQLIAESEDAYGAVFEDDIRLSPGAHALLHSSTWIPADAQFIKLETRRRAVTVARASRKVADGRALVRLFSFHDGLAGYLLSRSCARWLYQQTQRYAAPVDQLVLNPAFGIFDRLKAYQLTPSICIPERLADDVQPQHANLGSTIDVDGTLYTSDRRLLKSTASRAKRARAARALRQLAASVRRLANGQTRTRIEFR